MLLISLENERLINVLQMVQNSRSGLNTEGDKETLRVSQLEKENQEMHKMLMKDSLVIRSQKQQIHNMNQR